MAVVNRPREEDRAIIDHVMHGGQTYLIAQVCVGKRNRFRVFADGSYYSQYSGGVVARGKAERDTDGRMVTFDTQAHAEQWVIGGLNVVREIVGRV